MRITFLRELRTKEKMTLAAVAHAVGISESYYSLIETGGRGKRLSPSLAKKIAAVLGFDWQRFYEDDARTSA